MQRSEGDLANTHYKYFYTTHFGLSDADYADKFVIDIGCGPRGSLEWASMARRRIGIDPLATEYRKLGANHHVMEYLDASSENIPLRDGECDIVCSFNSLDHVEDVVTTLTEIKRLMRVGGVFLLLVEVNHPPTACEPHGLSPRRLVEMLKPELACQNLEVYEPVAGGIYDSIRANRRISMPEDTARVGFLSARFLRV